MDVVPTMEEISSNPEVLSANTQSLSSVWDSWKDKNDLCNTVILPVG